MTAIRRDLKAGRNRTGFALSALVAIAACAMYPRALAQQAPQPPYALFEQSTLTGSGNTIAATWLPIVTATGTTIYKNLTLQFNVDAAGNLTVAAGYPHTVPAPLVQVSSFRA